MEKVVNLLNQWVWSTPLVVLCLVAALYFSLGTRFVQVRHFPEMLRLLFHRNREGDEGITSFQAFSLALSGRVGTGNIVGVATAIGYGGPGAVVWMWIIAFLGAGTSFAESTLAQIFKESHGGELRGGPAYYIDKGLHCKPLAVMVALLAVVACGFFLPPVQSNSIALAFASAFSMPPWIIGLIVALLLGFVIVGGVTRIANWAQVIAPLMAMLYVLLSLVILALHITDVPAIFLQMVRCAFDVRGVTGGVLGITIAWGVKRGIYSNEAGQGTGAIVSAAAKVDHPVMQGLVQSFSVYIDTLLVCTATAVMILACGTFGPLFGEPGVEYTIAAVGTLVGSKAAAIIIGVALFFFAFTTMMAYYYYAVTNIVYLAGKKKWERPLVWMLRAVILFSVFYGSIHGSGYIWQIGDIGVGSMAWINIITILLLSPIVFRTLRSYENQQHNQQPPHFDPKALGIKDAPFWDKSR